MSIKQKARKYWEIWQNYEEKDLAYRVALLISTLLVVFLSIALVVSALRDPLVISVKNGVASVTTYARDSDSIDENEAKVFVKNFILHYYNWTPQTIEENLRLSLPFLERKLRKEIKGRMKEKVFDAEAKSLSQSVYVKEMTFDRKSSAVSVKTDRIFTIEKVKLSNDFDVNFKLVKNERTIDSPSGLLISEIKEPFAQK